MKKEKSVEDTLKELADYIVQEYMNTCGACKHFDREVSGCKKLMSVVSHDFIRCEHFEF